MNVGKLFALSPRERTFQLKARRDAGTDNPRWRAPDFFTCKKCERAPLVRSGPAHCMSAPTAGTITRWAGIIV